MPFICFIVFFFYFHILTFKNVLSEAINILIAEKYSVSCAEMTRDDIIFWIKKKFKDTKGVIRIRKSKKDRQCNGQKKEDKRTNNDLQNIT
jgi:adenylate cyclase class IV